MASTKAALLTLTAAAALLTDAAGGASAEEFVAQRCGAVIGLEAGWAIEAWVPTTCGVLAVGPDGTRLELGSFDSPKEVSAEGRTRALSGWLQSAREHVRILGHGAFRTAYGATGVSVLFRSTRDGIEVTSKAALFSLDGHDLLVGIGSAPTDEWNRVRGGLERALASIRLCADPCQPQKVPGR